MKQIDNAQEIHSTSLSLPHRPATSLPDKSVMSVRLLCLLLAPLMLLAQTPAKKLEAYVLMPEPSALRNANSRAPSGAHKTVFSPASESREARGVKVYTPEEFSQLGVGLDTFTERAKAAAEARLATVQAEFIKDESGKTRYAVYRGESPLIASLIIAPSLGKIYTRLFGGDVWAVLPDRHSLYLFPAKPEMLAEFAEDLEQRYKNDPYAASCEVFLVKPGEAPKVVASFTE